MKATIVLRIAAGFLLFFAVGHSIGHYTRHDVTDPKALEVQKQMIENKFDMFGMMRSYDENYTGMSLNLTFTLLAFTAIVWMLSSSTESNPSLVRAVLLPIIICVAGFSITGALYFFPVPAVTCGLAVIFMLYAWFKLK